MATLSISLVQTSLYWQAPQANRAHFDELLASPPAGNLIVLPEMFSTGFSMASDELAEPMTGDTVNWLAAKAKELGKSICGSVIIEADKEYLNRFLLAQPDAGLHHYDKRHLFRMANEHNHYAKGLTQPVIDIDGFRLCPQVCYDLRFPVWSRNSIAASKPYDLLIYVANWPAARREHWITLLRARAIENQCYVIGVNRIGTDGNDVAYCGDSLAIDFEGHIMADLASRDTIETVELDTAPLNAYRERFPAWKDADAFHISD